MPKPLTPNTEPIFLDHDGNEFRIGSLLGKDRLDYSNLTDDRWIPVNIRQPVGSPIVFMYSESNKEFSCGHFTLNRGGVPVTHWMPCVGPKS
jgi:hypothetical protein